MSTVRSVEDCASRVARLRKIADEVQKNFCVPYAQDIDDAADVIKRLSEALEDAADMLHECSLECADCDYGNGATGKASEGGVCETCSPTREAERRAREALTDEVRSHE